MADSNVNNNDMLEFRQKFFGDIIKKEKRKYGFNLNIYDDIIRNTDSEHFSKYKTWLGEEPLSKEKMIESDFIEKMTGTRYLGHYIYQNSGNDDALFYISKTSPFVQKIIFQYGTDLKFPELKTSSTAVNGQSFYQIKGKDPIRLSTEELTEVLKNTVVTKNFNSSSNIPFLRNKGGVKSGSVEYPRRHKNTPAKKNCAKTRKSKRNKKKCNLRSRTRAFITR